MSWVLVPREREETLEKRGNCRPTRLKMLGFLCKPNQKAKSKNWNKNQVNY
jgi:hypothetical protein